MASIETKTAGLKSSFPAVYLYLCLGSPMIPKKHSIRYRGRRPNIKLIITPLRVGLDLDHPMIFNGIYITTIASAINSSISIASFLDISTKITRNQDTTYMRSDQNENPIFTLRNDSNESLKSGPPTVLTSTELPSSVIRHSSLPKCRISPSAVSNDVPRNA